MPNKLIAGNWKMNGLKAGGTALAAEIARRAGGLADGVDLAVCPPAPLLAAIGEAIAGSRVALGGQDCHAEPSGAFTGDVAAEMLADLGCTYVIVGHSERREHHGESDADVAAKARAVARAGLVPIVCVGETEDDRNAGRALAVCSERITGSVPDGVTGSGLVVAYEPLWAIGTGRTPSLDEIREVHASIRRDLAARLADAGAVRILYGGSVKPANARDILAVPDVDGALVGGASLKADDFWAIASAA